MAFNNPSLEISLEMLKLEKMRLRKGVVARNTALGYGYDWRMFCAWAKSRGLDSLPATAETVALYLTDLLTQGKKITTARRRKCAIFYEHLARGLPPPESDEIRELLCGAQRLSGEKPRQMRPISVRELRRMSVKLARMSTPRALRDRALLVVGFASALRRSNLGALNLADIEFVSQGLILTIDREKGDQEGRGRLIGLARGRHAHTCPVRVLRAWLRVRGDRPGPLFPRFDRRDPGGPLDGESICRLVKKALTLIGIDPVQHGAHSLRAGFVTAAGEANVGELVIARHTGHQSMQVLRRYFRRSDIWRANASSLLGL
jgi:integrase